MCSREKELTIIMNKLIKDQMKLKLIDAKATRQPIQVNKVLFEIKKSPCAFIKK